MAQAKDNGCLSLAPAPACRLHPLASRLHPPTSRLHPPASPFRQSACRMHSAPVACACPVHVVSWGPLQPPSSLGVVTARCRGPWPSSGSQGVPLVGRCCSLAVGVASRVLLASCRPYRASSPLVAVAVRRARWQLIVPAGCRVLAVAVRARWPSVGPPSSSLALRWPSVVLAGPPLAGVRRRIRGVAWYRPGQPAYIPRLRGEARGGGKQIGGGCLCAGGGDRESAASLGIKEHSRPTSLVGGEGHTAGVIVIGEPGAGSHPSLEGRSTRRWVVVQRVGIGRGGWVVGGDVTREVVDG
ncbi:hypothetical protein BJ912DRAFT_934579 [Pholiota molesta]|nr:hypothetical protein BJ912DRAFT_934579 [Pholiota molesta]